MAEKTWPNPADVSPSKSEWACGAKRGEKGIRFRKKRDQTSITKLKLAKSGGRFGGARGHIERVMEGGFVYIFLKDSVRSRKWQTEVRKK